MACDIASTQLQLVSSQQYEINLIANDNINAFTSTENSTKMGLAPIYLGPFQRKISK